MKVVLPWLSLCAGTLAGCGFFVVEEGPPRGEFEQTLYARDAAISGDFGELRGFVGATSDVGAYRGGGRTIVLFVARESAGPALDELEPDRADDSRLFVTLSLPVGAADLAAGMVLSDAGPFDVDLETCPSSSVAGAASFHADEILVRVTESQTPGWVRLEIDSAHGYRDEMQPAIGSLELRVPPPLDAP